MVVQGSSPKRVIVSPDYAAEPVWDTDGVMVSLDHLPVSDRLRAALRLWARRWEELMGVAEHRYEIVDHDGEQEWLADGQRLADRLQAELGAGFQVSCQL